MVHLQHTNPTTKQTDILEHINNDDVTRILDALEHEMERYNKALDLVTDPNARHAINQAKKPLKELHTKFCHLLDPDEEEGDRLSENVVARLDYAGQSLDTQELEPLPEVDVNSALPYPVTRIRMSYPFEIEGNGEYNVYKIAPAKNWGELLTEVVKTFRREYEAGKAVAPHALGDYIVERIDIHPGDLATVGIGS